MMLRSETHSTTATAPVPCRLLRWKRIRRDLVFLLIAAGFAGCASTGTPGKGELPAPANALLSFYDKGLNHLSSVRSGTCPMHPSCSAYSREAFGRHGLVKGWWMTFDRLLRCDPSEVERNPVLVRGAWKSYDPVSHNDRWWHEPSKEPPTPRRTP